MGQYIKGDTELKNALDTITKKAPEATVYALNGLAYDVRKEVQGKLPQWVTLSRKFLPNSVVYNPAKTSYPAATVGFDKRANFVTLLEDGGTRLPNRKALAIPVDVKTTAKGSITAGNRPAAILQKQNVFAGVIDGIAGIWQKSKRIPLRLLYVFKPNAKYKKHFLHFRETADRVVQSNYVEKFTNAVNKILTK